MKRYFFALFFFCALWACSTKNTAQHVASDLTNVQTLPPKDDKMEEAILAGGCFWCTEAVFQRIKGVQSVVPGYIGGQTQHPTYKEICTGQTGHAEAIRIVFDPAVVSYQDLLEIFFHTHDPTTLNRQGNDVGTQYRSEIFYTTENQQLVAKEVLRQIDEQKLWPNKIVTKISQASTFYLAEKEHHNYYNDNSKQGYCVFVISPKIEKLEKLFKDKLD